MARTTRASRELVTVRTMGIVQSTEMVGVWERDTEGASRVGLHLGDLLSLGKRIKSTLCVDLVLLPKLGKFFATVEHVNHASLTSDLTLQSS